MSKRGMMGVVAVGLGLALGATALPGEAKACGGEWFPEVEIDYRPMGVAMAEQQLEAGDHTAAAATIVRVMPHVARLDPEKSKLTERAQRVLAVALARTGGTPDLELAVPSWAIGHWAGESDEDREANMEFAVSALRKINELNDNEPAAETELAEALALVDGRQAEAREILERLANKDLVATPEGQALLVELRAKAGDKSGKNA